MGEEKEKVEILIKKSKKNLDQKMLSEHLSIATKETVLIKKDFL